MEPSIWIRMLCFMAIAAEYSYTSYVISKDDSNHVERKPGGDIGGHVRRLEDDILAKQSTRPCPCADKTLCNRIKRHAKREVFAFGGEPVGEWKSYDWNVLTTVVEVNGHTDERICLAHAHGVRYTLMIKFPYKKLTDAAYRRLWVGWQISNMTYYFMDGVNLDFETGIPRTRYDIRDALTDLFRELSQRLRAVYPDTQISMDVAFSPWDFYDYKAITDVCDFVFIMDYPENSGTWYATANSNYTKTLQGVLKYIQIGIDPDKLIIGMPWYGFVFSCFAFNETNKCYTRKAYSMTYSDIVQTMLPKSSGRQWSDEAKSPFLNIMDPKTGNMSQVWYDDPESIGLKTALADELGLRGVGVWRAGFVNASDHKRAQEMWHALL